MTNSRKHLVEMLEHLVNEDEEKARLAFHEFVVQTARQIHESILEDDELEENIEEMKHDYSDEEYYGKKDMDEMEGEEEEEMDMNMDIGDAEAEEELGGEEEMDMEMDADMEGEEGEEVEVNKEAIVDVMDSMEELQAKFNELLGDAPEEEMDYDAEEGEMNMDMDAEEGGMDADMEEGMYEEKKAKKAKKDDYIDESGDSAGHGANDPSKAGVDSAGKSKKMNEEETDEVDEDDKADETVEEAVSHDAGVNRGHKVSPEGKHSRSDSLLHNEDAKLPESEETDSAFDFDLTEEDFQDLEEGLKALDVKMGGEQGGNKFAGEETQTKSPVAQRDKSDVKADAKNLLSKKDDHDGFDLEAAPSNTDLPHAGDNSRDDAEDGREGISGHGGLESQKGRKNAEAGAGKFAGTEGNVKSPIGSKGSREGR